MTPHQGYSVETAGLPVEKSTGAMLMLHGRGGTAAGILRLSEEFGDFPLHFVAPQATATSWYPQTFLAPIEENQPHLSSALWVVGDILGTLAESGVPWSRLFLLGFSQGACLSLEFVARNPRRYGGVFALSGGLIGPPGALPEHHGDAEGSPVFFGCSDTDPHIPKRRVEESADQFRRLNADVSERLYPGMEHTIVSDEIEFVRNVLQKTL